MIAGKRDRYVGLYHRVLATSNTDGERVESWPSAYASVWASKRDAAISRRGEKVEIADQFAQLQLTEFQILYRADLVATDKLIDDDGISYELVQIYEIGSREGLSLLCKAVHA